MSSPRRRWCSRKSWYGSPSAASSTARSAVRVQRHGIFRRADAEAPLGREPGVAQAPEAADPHRLDRAALALHERVQERDLREQRVARAPVLERAEAVDRLGRARRDAAPAAARLDVRGACARERRQRLVARQRAQRLRPAVARDDDPAAGLAHQRGGARRVGRGEHRLAVRPRLGDLGDEAQARAGHRDGARVREERRPVALVHIGELDDQLAALAHRARTRAGRHRSRARTAARA